MTMKYLPSSDNDDVCAVTNVTEYFKASERGMTLSCDVRTSSVRLVCLCFFWVYSFVCLFASSFGWLEKHEIILVCDIFYFNFIAVHIAWHACVREDVSILYQHTG